jgi:hypothetical protein
VNNVPPINEKLPVLEGKSNFLSGMFLRWLKDLVFRVNRAVVTDENGNIDFTKIGIPEDINKAYYYEFRGVNSYVQLSGGLEVNCLGCYLTDVDPKYRATISGNISLLVQNSTGNLEFYLKSGAVSGNVYDVTLDFTKTTIV